jgi:hypothetical protein
LIFFDLPQLSHRRHSGDFLDVHRSAGGFLEKARRVAEKVHFDGLFQGKLQAMKIKVVLGGPDDWTVNFSMGYFSIGPTNLSCSSLFEHVIFH